MEKDNCQNSVYTVDGLRIRTGLDMESIYCVERVFNTVRQLHFVHAWFLEIAFVCDVGMTVCVRPEAKLHSRDV